jgi:hypothetical protein
VADEDRARRPGLRVRWYVTREDFVAIQLNADALPLAAYTTSSERPAPR